MSSSLSLHCPVSVLQCLRARQSEICHLASKDIALPREVSEHSERSIERYFVDHGDKLVRNIISSYSCGDFHKDVEGSGRSTYSKTAGFNCLASGILLSSALTFANPDVAYAEFASPPDAPLPFITAPVIVTPLQDHLETQMKSQLATELQNFQQCGAPPCSIQTAEGPGPSFEDPSHIVPAFNTPATATGLTEVSLSLNIAGPAASAIEPALAGAATGLSAKLSQVLASSIQHFGVGGISGAVGATVVYPLDTVKTRMQAQKKSDDGDSDEIYEDEIDCITKVIQNEGIGALYSGLVPQLVGVAPEKAVKLTTNEIILTVLESFLPGARIWALEFIAGGGGGLAQVIFTNPVEAIKVRMQTANPSSHNENFHERERMASDESSDSSHLDMESLVPSHQKSTLEVIKELGVKGLYHGSVVTMIRDIPSTAIFFAIYAYMKETFPGATFVAGCVAALPSAYLVTPMDVVKTRMQMEPVPGEEPFKNGWDCAQRIIEKEGIRALFKGGLVRVLRGCPQFGITLMMYDMLCQ